MQPDISLVYHVTPLFQSGMKCEQQVKERTLALNDRVLDGHGDLVVAS